MLRVEKRAWFQSEGFDLRVAGAGLTPPGREEYHYHVRRMLHFDTQHTAVQRETMCKQLGRLFDAAPEKYPDRTCELARLPHGAVEV